MKNAIQISKEDLLASPILIEGDDWIENRAEENRLLLKLNNIKFDSLFIPNNIRNNQFNILYVFLAAGGRQEDKVRFDGWSWCTNLDGDLLCIEDPTYKLLLKSHKPMMTGWYFGDGGCSYLELISNFCNKLLLKGIYGKIIFHGTSAGAYAALYLSNNVPGSLAIASNPQIDIRKWNQYRFYREFKDYEDDDKFRRYDISYIGSSSCYNLIYHNCNSNEDVEQIRLLNNGNKVECGIAKVGNNLFLTSKTVYRPGHATFFIKENFMAARDLLLMFERANGEVTRELVNYANCLLKNVETIFNDRYNNKVRKARFLIGNLIINRGIRNVRLVESDVHTNVLIYNFNNFLRFDFFIVDEIAERCSFGIHVKKEICNADFIEKLRSLSKKLSTNFFVGDDELVKLYKIDLGIEKSVREFVDIVDNSLNLLSMLVCSDRGVYMKLM